jgi:hypothetical protein
MDEIGNSLNSSTVSLDPAEDPRSYFVKEESFEKLTRLKRIVGQMSIADRSAWGIECVVPLQRDAAE